MVLALNSLISCSRTGCNLGFGLSAVLVSALDPSLILLFACFYSSCSVSYCGSGSCYGSLFAVDLQMFHVHVIVVLFLVVVSHASSCSRISFGFSLAVVLIWLLLWFLFYFHDLGSGSLFLFSF